MHSHARSFVIAALLVVSSSVRAAPVENGLVGNGLVGNGVFTNGVFTNGVFTNGVFTNGVFTNGVFTNGLAENGVFTNGVFTNGVFTNGLAENGVFTNGVFTNGVFTNGVFTNGLAENGVFTNGVFTNGVFTNGVFTNGLAKNGVFTNGVFTNGVFTNGVFTNGILGNGVFTNGVFTNGVFTNGARLNNGLAFGVGTSGLAAGGLNGSALAQPAFAAWFDRDAGYSSMVMKYVVQCALPAGAELSYARAGETYTWRGGLGLAPQWSKGGAIPAAEQELVSACFAAHTNAFGKHVQISVRGYGPTGEAIPVTAEEVAGWRFSEATYFGNMFDGSGVYVALSKESLDPRVSTPRGCAAERGVPGSCGPMVQAGLAADRCTAGADGVTHASCSVNGRAFRPVQVFLNAADVSISE